MEKVEAKASQKADNRTPAQIAYDKVQEQRVNRAPIHTCF